VQLGLGVDGHTASLVPGDPVLTAAGDVATTGPYQGPRRMTLTFAAINRAERIVWIVGGADKRDAVRRLLAGDQTVPAGRVASDRAVLIVDRAALGQE
jgi:6-phosphogluconolactonase/glucosamine-6-phosphate isomerase/deaminase